MKKVIKIIKINMKAGILLMLIAAFLTPTIIVNADNPDDLEADIQIISLGYTGEFSSFICYATYGFPEYSYNYIWDFGNGDTQTIINWGSECLANTVFIDPSHYTVSVQVETSGYQASDSIQVDIRNYPSVAIQHEQYSAHTGETISFSATATGGYSPYDFEWQFGDSTPPVNIQGSSGVTTVQHVYTRVGDFTVRCWVYDSNPYGASGIGSDTASVHITPAINYPPNTPSTPSGPSLGFIDVSYQYSSTTTDINDDQIYYWFDWDDGTNSGWVGPYNTGQTGSASKIWSATGTYDIKVKAKDTQNAESGWSDTKSVRITYPQASVMIVEDDGPAVHNEQYYISALQGQTYYMYDVDEKGSYPAIEFMIQCNTVIWYRGNCPGLSPTAQSTIADYLNNWGKLFITGSELSTGISPTFQRTYLHRFGGGSRQTSSVTLVYGQAGSIFDGLSFGIKTGGDGANNNGVDVTNIDIDPADSYTDGSFSYNQAYSGGLLAGIMADALNIPAESRHRAVYLGYTFESIDNSYDRNQVMSRALNWLDDNFLPVSIIRQGPEGIINYFDVTFIWTGDDDNHDLGELQFQYRLKRGETWDTWTRVPSGGQHVVTYNDLPDGTSYIFEVQASEDGTHWGESAIRSFRIATQGMVLNQRTGQYYTTINAAVQEAIAGDQIVVYSGTYVENVVIDVPRLALIGQNMETTIIDGEGSIDYCIDITEDNVSVEGFTITHAHLAGIRIRSAPYEVNGRCLIYRNKIIDNNDGVQITGYYSGQVEYNTIARNIFEGNDGDGIYVYLADHNTISENTIDGEDWTNICLWSSDDNTIRSNHIDNSGIGIDLYSSCNNNRIYFNDITYNTNVGIRLSSLGSSHHNIIYWNNFFDNHQNAVDDNAGYNHWYLVDGGDNPIGRNGNYWDDWNGHNSYPIPGQASSVDLYPFSERDGWSHTHGGKFKCVQLPG